MSFKVDLPLFQGPFDLLLFFIERDELDIYDIPIAKLTDDFLDYLKRLEEMNLEVASEFILVAATLMRIKSKTLLPRKDLDEDGQEIDPREELVRHLLEYKRYKAVVASLAQLEEQRSLRQERGNVAADLAAMVDNADTEAEMHQLDLYKLLRAFQRVMDRHKEAMNKPRHTVVQFPFTLEEKRDYVLQKVATYQRVSFDQLLTEEPTKIAAIFNFLAILELLALGNLDIQLGEGFNQFWIFAPAEQETPA